jgi:polyisoprenoid-binding protein YceI
MRALLLAAAVASIASPATAGDYTIDGGASRIAVHVGKSGVLGFAGHRHEVSAHPSGGRVHADAQELSASSVTVEIHAADFSVDAEKEGAGDAPKVQATMEREVLETQRHPDISFTSSSVRGRTLAEGRYALELTGTLQLHGVRREMTVPVEVQVTGTTLTATGKLSLTHEAFGLKRASGGGGTVRVANELSVDFILVAHPAP